MTGRPVPDHPTEELSALLDGALPPDERLALDAHLAACPACRDELEVLAGLRARLRDLPEVDPPVGFFDDVLRVGPGGTALVRRRSALGLGAVVVAAGLWAGVVSGVRPVAGLPTLDELARAHDAVAAGVGAPPTTAAADASVGLGVPEQLAGRFRLAGARAVEGGAQAVYVDGRQTVSLFVLGRRLDPDRLPAEARPVRLDGRDAWSITGATGSGAVVIPQDDGTVVLIGAAPAEAPEVTPTPARHTWWDRVEVAARALLDTFGLRR